MSNFGFFDLRLVNPYEVAFREARSAVGAGAVIAATREYRTVAEAVADCTLVVGTTALGKRELHHPLRRLEYGARLLRRHIEGGPAALLFGSEKYGLANEDLSHCQWLMRIPTREEHRAMNLGQSVAVCLYELMRNAQPPKPEPRKPASAAELERITELLLASLEKSGYVNPRTAGSTAQKVRRMVRRLDLPARDSEIWMGMLRQILWKLDNSGSI